MLFKESYQKPGSEFGQSFIFQIPKDAPPSDYYETSGLKFSIKVKTWYVIEGRFLTHSKKN
jgi:hypothetical protein